MGIAVFFVWAIAAPSGYGQWNLPDPIRTTDDFETATQKAWIAAVSQMRNPDYAREAIAQALAWAKANPDAVGPARLGLLWQEDGDIALSNTAWDDAEAAFREALVNLDAATPPDPIQQFQVLRRIVEMGWYNNHHPQAIEAAKRLSTLSASELKKVVLLKMGAADTLPIGEADLSPRSAQEPIDMALRPWRTSLDAVVATLIDVPDAGKELAEVIMTTQAVVQDVAAGLQATLFQQEDHPPAIPDALLSYFRAVPRDPPTGKLAPLDRLRANAAAMSMLGYADPDIIPGRLPKPLQLQHERTGLERQIANTLQTDLKPALPEEIWQSVPDGSVVLEYAVYEKPGTAHEPHGEARYLIVAFSSKGVLKVADVGSFTQVNGLVDAACRAILRDKEGSVPCINQKPPDPGSVVALKTVGQELFNTLLGPVGDALAGATQLIIAPDGALQFFPFETLVDHEGNYLIGTHLVSYIQSPREIPRWKAAAPPSHGPPVIVADPDYDAGATPKPDDCSNSDRGAPHRLRAGNLDNFPRLCGSADEARLVRETLPDAVVLTRDDATEEAVKGLFGPRILHLATHGFVVRQLNWPKAWHRADRYGLWWDLLDFQVMDNDALLRSGLVFAGANIRRSPGGHDDGILSAREAALLNLNGTQLVVLSACDSALGTARAGDGVIGLRRAFVLAGARAQTFSLWPVGDFTTAEFMRRYYTLLSQGEGNADALARVKREFLARGGVFAEPWIWAVFVGYGYPGELGK